MATIVISRIQNRRGLRVDLPQPLAPGELGWCTDTKQLFIGGDPAEPPIGIQVFTDILGSIASVQTIVDDQIVPVAVTGSFAASNLTALIAAIVAVVPTYDVNLCLWDGAAPGTVNVGFEVADETNVLAAITSYGTGAGVGTIDFSGTNTGVSYTAPDVGLGVTVDTDGTFSLASQEIASDVASIINLLYGDGIASTLLNIEITDLNPDVDIDVLIGSLVEYTLTPTYPAYADFPSPAISYTITDSDIFFMKYSAKMEDGVNHWSQAGELQIVSSLDQTDASASDISNEIRNFAAGDDLDIQAVFVGPSTVKLQYRHNFAQNVLFKPYTIRWASF